MALDLSPLHFDFPSVVKGDTFPAMNFTDTAADEQLQRVRVTFKQTGETSSALTLDSATTGVTINTATAGAWDFTINKIPTVLLEAAIYTYDLETTTTGGTIRTEFVGFWEITEGAND